MSLRGDHIEPKARLDHFAELLSQDIEIPAICQRMGISKGCGHALVTKLRVKFGDQAA